MKPSRILPALALASALPACSAWSGGGVRLEPLPAAVVAPCPHPATLLSRGGTVADDEVSLGRIGSALIACGEEKQLAVDAYAGARAALRAR